MDSNPFTRIGKSSSIIVAGWIIILSFLITADVVGRFFFNSPLMGTPELVRNSIAIIAFLQIPFSISSQSQLRATALVDKVKIRTRKLLNAISFLLGAIFMFLLGFSQIRYAITAWKILEYEGEGALRVPTYPGRTVIVIWSLLGAVEFARLFYRELRPKDGTEKVKG